MPSKPAHEHGVLARVRSHLRGDRFMVDAWPADPPVPVVPEPTAAQPEVAAPVPPPANGG